MNYWDTPVGALAGANAFCSLNLVYLLIEKGIITQAEGASVFTKTANQIRDGSEDGPSPEHGEAAARMIEQFAAWTLGRGPTA